MTFIYPATTRRHQRSSPARTPLCWTQPGRERGTDVLELKVALGQISEAVRSVVPESMWGEIVAKLEELEQQPEALDVDTDDFDDDDPYDPTEFIDEDDEF